MNCDLQAPSARTWKKTQVNTRRNTQKILICVSLTRRTHKPDETGAPRKIHMRIRLWTHMSAYQRKVDLGELT